MWVLSYISELLGIIGPNVPAKTTLVNLITGFVKPDSGTVEYKGKDIPMDAVQNLHGSGIARTFQMIRPVRRTSCIQESYYFPLLRLE